MASIFPLKNEIMPYAWGSTKAIAALLGYSSPSKTPQAELWMGAHPKAPSSIPSGEGWMSLNDSIEKEPEAMLGAAVAERYENRLPFLFKVLAVAKPLSIQAHPNRTQAEKGFAREEALGIPIDAPQRNYRDANHKPECICALTPFWALNGFRPLAEIVALLKKACPQTLWTDPNRIDDPKSEAGLKRIFNHLLTLPPDRKSAVLNEAVLFSQAHAETDAIWHWMVQLARYYPDDIGILSPLILNLVCLSPGQAMYLPAGRIHAYLEGAGLELMANSDNVLRGGLTAKHIDVDELLNILHFEPITITPIKPRLIGLGEEIYDTPSVEFSLAKIILDVNRSYTSMSAAGARIILCVDGSLVITDNKSGEEVAIKKGQSVFVSGSIVVYSLAGKGICYVATVPLEKND